MEAALGRGGMGAVYLVFDEVVGERVALKTLTANDASATERFKRELRLARRVTHKNVGRTFDIGVHEGTMFITMEAVEGESLRGRMFRQGILPRDQIAAVLAQSCAALAAAHEAGVVHRDLKPSNILIDGAGRVVVIDFGIAAPAHVDLEADVAVSGTYDYMSPEALLSSPPKPEDDIYALGLVTFELATLRRPFSGPDARSRGIARLDEPPDLRPLEPDPELLAIVRACLERDPSRRPSAASLERRFASLGGDSTTSRIEPAPVSSEVTVADSAVCSMPSIVVARFDVMGRDEGFGLGGAIAEEISDALARSRGLRVIASSVMRPPYDLRELRRSFGVDWLVSGSIQRGAGDASTVVVRLVATDTGSQVWTERFVAPESSWLDIGSTVAVRIAEALRLELEALGSVTSAGPEAAMAFLEGRLLTRRPVTPAEQVVGALDRCLELAPNLPLAVAARALASVRAWLASDDVGHDWAEEARAWMDRALHVAPGAVDTSYASALMSTAAGDFRDALTQLRKVLDRAPTHALAQESYGRIECEAGRADVGMRRLACVLEIDPMRRPSLCGVARAHALRGRIDAADETLRRVAQMPGPPTTEELIIEARIAIWFRDRARAARVIEAIPQIEGHRRSALTFVRMLAGFAAGETERYWELHAFAERLFARHAAARRARGTAHQVTAEYEAALGDPMRGLKQLELANEAGIIDLEWLERCPALDILRDEERFERVRAEVRKRAAAIWVGAIVPPIPASR